MQQCAGPLSVLAGEGATRGPSEGLNKGADEAANEAANEAASEGAAMAAEAKRLEPEMGQVGAPRGCSTEPRAVVTGGDAATYRYSTNMMAPPSS